jgi:hypothetical protein
MTTAELREWKQIQKFVAERRRLWPGAKITIRPDKQEKGDER